MKLVKHSDGVPVGCRVWFGVREGGCRGGEIRYSVQTRGAYMCKVQGIKRPDPNLKDRISDFSRANGDEQRCIAGLKHHSPTFPPPPPFHPPTPPRPQLPPAPPSNPPLS